MLVIKIILKEMYLELRHLCCPKGLKKIGKKTIFRKPLRILGRKYISIGDYCDIMNGIRLEAVPKWNGDEMPNCPEIHIENHVIIGQNCHFTAANKIIIGEGTNILPDVLITDIKHISQKNKSLCETGIVVGSVTIGKYVQIGMGARIMANGKDIVIGNNAVIGANAVVTNDVEEGATVVGIPARKLVKIQGR